MRSEPGAPTDASIDLVPGVTVGRYILLQRLGAGAMGVVFAAHDPELDRKVAVKALRGDLGVEPVRSSLRARLLREAQAMARLSHPNVVAVHDVGSFGDHIFIAMELVDGQTLAQWLAVECRPLHDVLAKFIAAGHGLAAAHAAGLVHRDFKPENVLIGNDGRVRVTDFGLAHRTELPIDPVAGATGPADRGTTTTGFLAGTPFYMAPEQRTGSRVDARTDQFSFCIALYAAVTGEHPFGPAARSDGARRDAMPAWLWRALRRGLEVDRELRYPSLDALLPRLVVGSRRRRRLRLTAVVAAGAVVAATAIAGVAGTTKPSSPGCEGAGRLLSGIWDEPRAHAIEDVFRVSGRSDATTSFAAASLLLDQYAKAWTAMRTDACQRPDQRSESFELIANLRIRCLDARLSELRVLTNRLTIADAALVDGAAVAVQALGKLEVCTDDVALQRPTQSDVAARPGPLLAVDGAHRPSYFVSDANATLWQVRADERGNYGDRIYVVDAVIGRPWLVVDADQHVQVFAHRVDDVLWRAVQTAPGGTWRLERVADGVTGEPAVILAGNRLVAFARKADGWLWRYWQDAPTATTWTAVRAADVVTGRAGVAFDVAGDLYSFVRKADGTLWYARHVAPAAPPDPPVKLAEKIAGGPTVVRDAVQKLTYYVRRNDGVLMTGYQEAAGSRIWHAVLLADGVAGDPSVAFDREGKQICVMRKTDGVLWSAIQPHPDGGDWQDKLLGQGIAADPTVIRGADDRLVYLVRKADGSLSQGQQDAALGETWHEQAVK